MTPKYLCCVASRYFLELEEDVKSFPGLIGHSCYEYLYLYLIDVVTFLIFVTRTGKQSRYHAIVFFFFNEHAKVKETNQSLLALEL